MVTRRGAWPEEAIHVKTFVGRRSQGELNWNESGPITQSPVLTSINRWTYYTLIIISYKISNE